MPIPEWTPLLTVIQMISAIASWHPQAAAVDRNDALCLARNIYFEARGESSRGQYAVASVTLNRVREKRWPDGICGVVYQSKQFSWTISRPMSRPTVIDDRTAWQRAAEVAVLSLVGLAPDYSRGATHYVAPKRLRRMPVWTASMTVSHRIDGHVFFSERRGRSAPASGAAGPRRNAPRPVALPVPVVASAEEDGKAGDSSPAATAATAEETIRVDRPGALPVLPAVTVEAALALDSERTEAHGPHRQGNRHPKPQPWSWSHLAGTAADRRVRSGARRVPGDRERPRKP
ncbi:cell wall hydrolase [Skermanella sp. TT6]|uniref:Cell wall hydrolase n=1 Tax=Skermanella cutis TaxID=2775420 RepID=A0ABX7B1T7_9PROT|nr:cell wall hydrolase [Skermanella sp. TT6]QQP88098.1 cell wall hydrolase [Skermanella sp. TT6]